MQTINVDARCEQAQLSPIRKGDRVRSVHAARTGAAVKVYADGSAAVCWDDGDPQPEGLAHERMPRQLLEVLEPVAPSSATKPSYPSVHTAASILDFDHFRIAEPNNTGSVVLRRAANAIRTIARLVSNSVRDEGNDEPVGLSLDTQAGLLDALELIAYAMEHEAEMVDGYAEVEAR